ncbi:MAG: hypothetical protein M3N49_10585 [Candidatus Eremiobacteraeota bacterium]|nr:hypothetical protein [Candidatus Eremiobacteraeota bacterium]
MCFEALTDGDLDDDERGKIVVKDEIPKTPDYAPRPDASQNPPSKGREPDEPPPPTLDQMLPAAEQLLIYAAENGIAIDEDVAQRIIAANHAGAPSWDGAEAGKLLAAIAALAAKVRPVTADALTWGRTTAPREIRNYTIVALSLVLVIVPLSILSFITTGLSNSINTSLQTANTLAVSLHTQLDPASSTNTAAKPASIAAPPASLGELQQFAATIRAVRDHTVQLNHFLFGAEAPSPSRWKDGDYELDPNLENSVKALRDQTNHQTEVFQDVRRRAKDVQDIVSLYYGAVGTFVLPMLYALLGACAYLLRLFSKELSSGLFSNKYDIAARFFIALIGGLIVGLFNNFTITGASLSPLALAFLVGYAADVFFTFLENLLLGFKKSTS